MEQQTPTPAASQSSDPPQPTPTPTPAPAPTPQTSQPPASTTPPVIPPSPNPTATPIQNPSPKPSSSTTTAATTSLSSPSLPQPSTRPPSTFSRPVSQQPHYPHFSSLPSSSSQASSSGSPSISTPPPRGGMAIGVPAHHASSSPQTTPYSSSFGQHFTGLSRTGVSATDSVSNPNAPPARPTMQGVQGTGMLGSLGSSSQMRPGGIPVHHQQRPVQSSVRPLSTQTNQPSSSQNLQGHGLMRLSPVGTSGSSPNTTQSMQSINQPWLSAGSPGKPPLPSPANRHQVTSQMQQRAHPPQQQHHMASTATQHQHLSPLQQQQPSPSNQSQEHYAPQFPPSRVPQALSHQQQITRVQGSGSQKSSSHAMMQTNTVQSGSQNKTTLTETNESCDRILSKRSIHELVSQVDPSEKLDPEVEDILVDIAEDFVESITTFGCSFAKHRKSTTLEAKDILLHLERNWNMTLPGFGGDEIKSYRKPLTNDVHKERLAAVRKSIVATETATKTSAGQASGHTKGHLAKTPASSLATQN